MDDDILKEKKAFEIVLAKTGSNKYSRKLQKQLQSKSIVPKINEILQFVAK